MYADVHTHLTHEAFHSDLEAVVTRARDAGLGAMVVNGLDPVSNRQVLALAARFPLVRPALGIYPVHAVNHLLPADFRLEIPRFNVDAEIAFIRSQAEAGTVVAIGECGMDGYWPDPATFPEQERVFRALIAIAVDHDLPVIVHSRKLEQRTIDILRDCDIAKVDMHCFGGKVRLAQECAEKDGWCFSIPANARVNEAFRKMLRTLPMERILTETDAPYLAPVKGGRSEPADVVQTVAFLAELRGMSAGECRDRIWSNYLTLFGKKGTPKSVPLRSS